MRSDCSSRELELWSWDAGKQRKFWSEKLLSYVGFPRTRTRDGDSCASDLLKECCQEKESEGIRIEQGSKVSKDRAREVSPEPGPAESSGVGITHCVLYPAPHWFSAVSPSLAWVHGLPETPSQDSTPQPRAILLRRGQVGTVSQHLQHLWDGPPATEEDLSRALRHQLQLPTFPSFP